MQQMGTHLTHTQHTHTQLMQQMGTHVTHTTHTQLMQRVGTHVIHTTHTQLMQRMDTHTQIIPFLDTHTHTHTHTQNPKTYKPTQFPLTKDRKFTKSAEYYV